MQVLTDSLVTDSTMVAQQVVEPIISEPEHVEKTLSI